MKELIALHRITWAGFKFDKKAAIDGIVMLKPKAEIAIVYGHQTDLREAALEAIDKMSADGFRVRSRVLTKNELKKENTNIFDALLTTFQELDAAIVFMTADDFGLSKKDVAEFPISGLTGTEVVNRLHDRSRQNVVFELGLLIGALGHQQVRLIGPRTLEYPSDIQGFYVVDELTPEGVLENVRQIIVERLRLKPTPAPLSDNSRMLSYANIGPIGSDTLKVFEKEFNRLEDENERLVYLLERIVFESYLQVEITEQWWSKRVATIDAKNDLQNACKQLLKGVTDYMAWWRPPDVTDYQCIGSCVENLERIINVLTKSEVAPIAKIVAYDYLGLAYDKVARDSGVRENQRKDAVTKSLRAFQACLDFAERYDDHDLHLWKGYALFNLARTNHLKGNKKWRKLMKEAVAVRSSWQRAGHTIPEDVEEGLIAEYFHAVASQAELDDELTTDQIKLLFGQYEDWRVSARKRVRLTINVANTWQRIFERNPTIRVI